MNALPNVSRLGEHDETGKELPGLRRAFSTLVEDLCALDRSPRAHMEPWILPNQNRRLKHIKGDVDFLSTLLQLSLGGDDRTNHIICQKGLLMSSLLSRLQIPLIQQRPKVAYTHTYIHTYIKANK